MNAGLIICFLIFLPSIFLKTNAQEIRSYTVMLSERPHGDLTPQEFYIKIITPIVGRFVYCLFFLLFFSSKFRFFSMSIYISNQIVIFFFCKIIYVKYSDEAAKADITTAFETYTQFIANLTNEQASALKSKIYFSLFYFWIFVYCNISCVVVKLIKTYCKMYLIILAGFYKTVN